MTRATATSPGAVDADVSLQGTEAKRLVSFDGGVSGVCDVQRPDRYRLLEASAGSLPRIARGGGYSYAAASFGRGSLVLDMTRFDRVLDFDPAARRIEVEAGMRLGQLLRITARDGLWLPVQPGYPEITVGGCVAADVHGKNPAASGTFTGWVEALRLLHPRHGTVEASRTENPELFELTSGGYGLTGVIVAATLRLAPLPGTRLRVTREAVRDAGAALERILAADPARAFTYTWQDATPRRGTFGAGVVYEGTFLPGSAADELRVPAYPVLTPGARALLPRAAWTAYTTAVFNSAFRARERRAHGAHEIGLFDSLFPFARRSAYFMLYGRAGLAEVQALVPRDAAGSFLCGLERILVSERAPSVLLSLKLFRETRGLLRFAADGVCLTVDLRRTPALRRVLPALDDLCLEHGALPNVAKDSRVPARVVRASYPGYETFRATLREHDPDRLFRSELSERLEL